MAFEKTILALCEDAGIQGAYFAYGTLFIPCDQSTDDAYLALEQALGMFKHQVSNAGDEVAVDFV